MRTNPWTRRLAAGMALTLLAAACADDRPSAEPLTSQAVAATVVATRDDERGVERSASSVDGAEDWSWVDASRGGNGWSGWDLSEDYCHTRLSGDKVWNATGISLCFFLVNDALRFTRNRGEWTNFPLTVSRYLNGVANAALGGESRSGYWGELQGARNCTNECNGRLTPNPFRSTAIMQFCGHRCSGMENQGTKARLFLNTGAAPMRLTDRAAQPEYDLPLWSSTNYNLCEAGAWLTCRADPFMPDGGRRVVARFTIGTLPLEIDLINALGPRTTLRRQGNPQVSGLLLDNWVEVNGAVVGGEQTGFYGGYRAADGRNASFVARYTVADTAGNTTVQACRAAASDTRPLGCGTTLDVSVSIDSDGRNRSSCQASTTDTRIIRCEVTVLGSPTGPMTAIVRVSDF